MTDNHLLLFAYGTLLDQSIQRMVIGRVVTGTPDQLDGYYKITKKFPDGSYPAIIKQNGSSVSGMVLELTNDELLLCDVYEGAGYFRKIVSLVSGTDVWVYVPVFIF